MRIMFLYLMETRLEAAEMYYLRRIRAVRVLVISFVSFFF